MKGVKLVSALLIVFMFYLIPMRTEANWSLLGMALAGILMSSLFTSYFVSTLFCMAKHNKKDLDADI